MRPTMISWAVLWAVSLPAFGDPLPAGEWLVALGRDYPLSPQAGLSDADAGITLSFMEAASRIDPRLADAYLWQYDLLAALGRDEQAREQLGLYIRLRPDDISAQLNWVAMTVNALQTAEARAETCRKLIERGDWPEEVASDLHYRLAVFHVNRGERDLARTEAQEALRASRYNLAAQDLLDELSDVSDTPARRVYRLLTILSMTPADAGSAWQLANELRSLGLRDQADRWYDHAEAMCRLVGHAPPRELVTDRTSKGPASQPAPADATQVRKWLDMFPPQILDYPSHPDKYLSLSLEMASKRFAPGEPWPCTVKLQNVGPFPITLGQGMMVMPELLCAIQTRGDQTRTSGPTIRVSLGGKPRLMPGESIEVSQTLDVGVIRAAMIGTPQIRHEVELSAVLSPVTVPGPGSEEIWTADIGGLVATPVRFWRSSFVPSPSRVDQLIARSRDGDAATRISNTQLLAMLLAEHQHVTSGRLDYRVRSIDVPSVRDAILARTNDSDWYVRARLAECLRWFSHDERATRQAYRLAQDQHWLVRGLAMRMLVDHYHSQMTATLERYARDDPDQWVRQLCSALIARMPPTTQPAEAK